MGDSRPNDQAERRKGSGRLHTYREVCGSDKGNVNKAGYFECGFVEMTLVVGQGVISLLGRYRGWKVSRQGAISLLGGCRGWKVSGRGVISPR